MDVFEFRNRVIDDYEVFSRSFTKIRAADIADCVDGVYQRQHFWPAPLIQLNPRFVPGNTVEELSSQNVLHPECTRIFRAGKTDDAVGTTLRLHKHQQDAIVISQRKESYVLTTGTGSGKSLAYFIPIIDVVLKEKAKSTPHQQRIRAIVIYPMNALANSQTEELEKFLRQGYAEGAEPVTFARYTGQESQEQREQLAENPPDILLTNFMMLELIMTRLEHPDPVVIQAAKGLQFLVLDELHTYRGRQGADVALLVRRVREALNMDLICIGTSATMISEGSTSEKNKVVSDVASRLFGTSVRPENIITETLSRITSEAIEPTKEQLLSSIEAGVPENAPYESLQRHPLSIWIETNLGLVKEHGVWLRAQPNSVENAARKLSDASSADSNRCEKYLTDFLLLAYRKGLFAFRLHQFISGAGDLFTTLEKTGQRYIDITGQQFQPGDRDKRLFNVSFCRECGQEYYPVWAAGSEPASINLEPRDLNERSREDDEIGYGFFMPDETGIWDEADPDRYPEHWIDFTREDLRLKPHFKKHKPRSVLVQPDGTVTDEGLPGWFLPGNFRFCLACGVSYQAYAKDSTRLSGLSSEGRSSATTVISIAALRYMIEESKDLSERAKKLLGFTDNRQDAALQSGHFNDFIQILLLRGALLAAVDKSEKGYLSDRDITQEVFHTLGFDSPEVSTRSEYMSNPGAQGPARSRAEDAMRDVLGYRLYYDLRRGWRINNPNLEQLGLLNIDYAGIEDLSGNAEIWRETHPLLANAHPPIRREILRRLLESMRKTLCIKTKYLDHYFLEQIQNASHNYLKEPWGFTEDERPSKASHLVPGPKPKNQPDNFTTVPLSIRSQFGKELRKPSTWGLDNTAHFPDRFTEQHFDRICSDLLTAAQKYGLIEPSKINDGRTGYRVVADILQWHKKNDDSDVQPASVTTDNRFFTAIYANVAALLGQQERVLFRLKAREHTAQVEAEDRQDREERFRSAELPVLFCSPTMELGVDIAELNTVYMRNVPPTPANYAQRSGRAGRAGQPALVITYCAALSPHDQYFFADPVRMVHGQVSPPTLDLANESLVRNHIYAVWLNETKQKLSHSINGLLDMEKPEELPLRQELVAAMDSDSVRNRTVHRVSALMGMLATELNPEQAPWCHEEWADRIMRGAFLTFDRSLDRWRELYLATTRQMNQAHQVQLNAAASERERQEAAQRYNEARTQQTLLLQSKPTMNSDFYTYRYLASQGFLPGYNFPRLPLMAFIPARREKIGRDSFLSRPRFLAISEFGPLGVIYHEGSQYRVRKVIIGVRDEEGTNSEKGLPVKHGRICNHCGYGHFGEQRELDRCRACDSALSGGLYIPNLYRIENVSTRRVTRITSDEEERLRQGYEMQTTFQFAEDQGRLQVVRNLLKEGGTEVLELQYGPAATLWRINLGWRRRKEKSIYGFNIDVTTGFWSKDEQAPQDEDQSADTSCGNIDRITPFAEDRRNVLILRPLEQWNEKTFATLQYALKRGIESVFQLEESELVAEPLPNRDFRNAILFFESAEGGAGVLTRLANDTDAMHRVAARALEICHYRSPSDQWQEVALENMEPNCEAVCYRCLLSYYNQPDHTNIDRKDSEALTVLCRLTQVESQRGTFGRSAGDQFEELLNLCGSTLEKDWLDHVQNHGYRLPDRAQFTLTELHTRPDFGYSKHQALVYIDGPHHEQDVQKRLDEELTTNLEDHGFVVIRFPKESQRWPAVFDTFPDIFGEGNP